MKKTNPSVKDFLLAVLVPMLIGKNLIRYFGISYSAHPGAGYGWGLALSILFTLGTIGRFLWKYRNTRINDSPSSPEAWRPPEFAQDSILLRWPDHIP